jgi:hypothetical protein
LGHDTLAQAFKKKPSTTELKAHVSPSAKDSKVNERIALFTEAVNFGRFLEAKVACERIEDTRRERLADEGPEDDIVGDEGKVPPGLCIAGVVVR